MEKEAIWIGYDWKVGRVVKQNRFFAFRKGYKFPSLPKRAVIEITADSRFKLYVNGVLVLRGPSRSTAHIQRYETVDISPFLRKGENVVAVLVHWFGTHTGAYVFQNRMGLWIFGKAEFRNRKSVPIVTDLSWEVAEANWYGKTTERTTFEMGFQELFDARREPENWMKNISSAKWRFRRAWFVGTTGCHPWWYMEPSEFKPLVEKQRRCLGAKYYWRCKEVVLNNLFPPNPLNEWQFERLAEKPKQVKELDNGNIKIFPSNKPLAITLDFGYVSAAYPEVEIHCSTDGLMIENYFHIVSLPTNAPFCESIIDRFICKDRKTRWQSYLHRGYRFHTIVVNNLKKETILKVRSIETHYPVEEKNPFKTDNDTVNEIFEVSCQTLKHGMLDALVDNCWREQSEWLGDGVFSGVAAIASFGSKDLLRSGLINWGRMSMKSGMLYSMGPTNYTFENISDFALWWVWALKRYHFLTGDISPLEKTFDNLIKLMRYVKDHSSYDGLFVPGLNEPVFIDWTDMDRMPYGFTINLLALQAWESAAYVYRIMGRYKLAKEALVIASRLRKVIERKFWDSFNNAWVEHIEPSKRVKKIFDALPVRAGSSVWHRDPGRKVKCPCSLHGNALSVLMQMGTKKQKEGAVSLIKKALVPGQKKVNELSPIWAEIAFSSLFEAGEDKEALAAIINWYGPELKRGYTAWPEHFPLEKYGDVKVEGDVHQTVGSSINTVFVRYLLGIRCEDVGYKSVVIDIHDCGLKYAQGKVFTPYGNIDVEWERKNEKIYVKVKSPKEIRVRTCSSKMNAHVLEDQVCIRKHL